MTDHEFLADIYFNYLNYKRQELSHRRIKHHNIKHLIDHLDRNLFEVSNLGVSVENRELKLITFGKGKKKVFMWSQMHGDESTATMALFDLIHFLGAYDHLNHFRKKVSEEITLYMFPMVNPDGAEMFDRRNSHYIDLNRDVINPQTPEARILKDLMINLKADFGFNLHDQEPKYSAGLCNKTAAISFLAPAYNFNRDVNKTRGNAMRLISQLAVNINHYIPGHIAKYTDEYEQRAFGDFCQSLGTSTILIESGWWPGDSEKQFIRKLNFLLLSSALKSIAEGSYKKVTTEVYDALPFNADTLYDVIIRGVKVCKNNIETLIDVALSRIDEETFLIEDLGDLSTFFGHKEFRADELKINLGCTELKPDAKTTLVVLNQNGEQITL